jgi:SPP1 gp7 family putative phage head morphogenesis protein
MLMIRKASRPRLPPMDNRERGLARALVMAARAVAAATDRAKVAAALEAYNPQAALDAIRWDVGVAELESSLPKVYRGAYEDGGTAAARKLSLTLGRVRKKLNTSYSFNSVSPTAVAWARDRSAALIKEFGASSQKAIQALIVKAFENGVPPRDLAKLIVDSGIGLTERQVLAVERRRERMIDDGATEERASATAERYSSQLLRSRGEVIARTEIIAASREGTQESWRQAAEEGLIDLGTATQEWMTTPDERLCDICEPLDGKQAKLGETFPGGLTGPPAHPQCRCALALTP